MSPPGARGPAYIVPSSESGPSDQTDINRIVFLDPLGQWSMIREVESDWPKHQGGRPRGEGGRPVPEPARLPVRSRGLWSLLDDRKLRVTLISLCKPDMWAFPPYFLITPCRNRQTPNHRILSDKTLSLGVGCIWILFFIYLMIIFGT